MASKNAFIRFLKSSFRLVKTLGKDATDSVLESLSPENAVKFKNVIQTVKGRPVRYAFDTASQLYTATEDGRTLCFLERMRGFNFYPKGISRRIDFLANSYFLPKINFANGDIVIDCGANIGELFFWFDAVPADISYISFEPSAREFSCVERNALSGSNHQIALSSEDGNQDFYISTAGADSSLIEPSTGYTEVASVVTKTLDTFLAEQNISKLKLLKLEAEGLEVEILQGAKTCLKSIEYIAVDGGEERGMSAQSTIEPICNMLIPLGFELLHLDITSGMGRGLFRNTHLENN